MICCVLALLFVGPLGFVLAPIWNLRRDASGNVEACCSQRYVILRSAAVVMGVALFGALIAAGLNFPDPPAFRHLCTFRLFR